MSIKQQPRMGRLYCARTLLRLLLRYTKALILFFYQEIYLSIIVMEDSMFRMPARTYLLLGILCLLLSIAVMIFHLTVKLTTIGALVRDVSIFFLMMFGVCTLVGVMALNRKLKN